MQEHEMEGYSAGEENEGSGGVEPGEGGERAEVEFNSAGSKDNVFTEKGDSEEGPEAGREVLLDTIARERSRAEDYYNRLVRLQADFENFRKRVSREREDLLKYANEQLITALLPVMDNLERALSAKSDDAGKVHEGVEMISRQIKDILTCEGLESIASVGEQFNPELHEAVMSEECAEYPENTVIEELRKGFSLKGKVIRAAMVKVSI